MALFGIFRLTLQKIKICKCMKHYISIIILAIFLFSCNGHSKHWETLSQVESYIEEKPDSALVTLEQIDFSELSGKEEKAKYSLLYSMALDKNFVDKADFEVLQPAIDYYEDNGSATDKLRTYYYQGRIYQNIGNDALAMESYVNAINNGEHSDDILTKARLYVAQGNIYASLLKWDSSNEVNTQAAEYFYEKGKIDSYVNCLLKVCNGYIQNNDYDKAEMTIHLCNDYIDEISNNKLGKYYSALLIIQIHKGDEINISTTIEEYHKWVSEENRDYIAIANAYLAINDSNKALNILVDRDYSSNINQEMRYLATLAGVYESQGNHKLALETYLKYYELHDIEVYSIFKQDTQFVEERHSLELQNIQEQEAKNRIILLSIILVSILLVIVIYIRGRLKLRTIQQAQAEQEAERYKLLYEQMEYEKDNLSELLSHSNDLDNNIRSIIAQRIQLLNKFFTVYITNNSEISRKVDKELDELLANKDTFMSSTRLAFAGSHPNFIKYLEDHNLTEREIEYCCLYALGLKGKEVGSYIKMRSHFNISSDVRKKLGLVESDTNLGIYIRKLLMSL